MGRRLNKIVSLYVDGFRNMTIGRSLWALIIIKCVLIFAVVKVIFFPDVLEQNYSDDESRAAAVREALASPQNP